MILLVGKTASGKSTILKELIKMGYIPVVTYTTRPPREGEVDGVDYNFISDKQFEKFNEEDFFAETTSYEIDDETIWKYGTAKKDLDNDKVEIINPKGLKTLKHNKDLDITTFLLLTDEGNIWNRLRSRGDHSDDAHRRIEADKKDFANINEYIDYAIRTDKGLSVKQVAELIDYIYKVGDKN